MIVIDDLPAVNATLNSISAGLLIGGYLSIRRKNVAAHRSCMLSACGVSGLFLLSYLYYHYHAGATTFTGRGWVRPAYFAMLISHIVLAAVMLPFIFITVRRGLSGNIERHRRIARWTLPMWLYVSVTGVLVYVVLYHLYPNAG